MLLTDLFHLKGPEFLEVYLKCWLIAVGAILLLRLLLFRSMGDKATVGRAPLLTAYELAMIAGGRDRVFQSAVARLLRDRCLSIARVPKGAFAIGHPPQGAVPLERAIHRQAQMLPGSSMKSLRSAAGPDLDAMTRSLTDAGLLVPQMAMQLERMVTLVLCTALLVMGGIKLAIGVSLGKPVGFLVLLGIAGLIVTILLLVTVPRTTRRGREVLRLVRDGGDSLRQTATAGGHYLGGLDAAMAVALFGPVVLAGPEFDEFRRMFKGDACSGSSGGESWTAGCGVSGGDSGGGGGCGGCGGCGGGS